MEILESILCDLCSNAGRGVQLQGKRVCLDCCQDSPALVVELVHVVMPAMAKELEDAIRASGIK